MENNILNRKLGFLLYTKGVSIEAEKIQKAFAIDTSGLFKVVDQELVNSFIDSMINKLVLKSKELISKKLDFEQTDYNDYLKEFDYVDLETDREYILEVLENLNSIRKKTESKIVNKEDYTYLVNLWINFTHLSNFQESWYRTTPALYFSNSYFNNLLQKNKYFLEVYENIEELDICEFLEIDGNSLETYYVVSINDAQNIIKKVNFNSDNDGVIFKSLLEKYINSKGELILIAVYEL
jgi:hypothetical protein